MKISQNETRRLRRRVRELEEVLDGQRRSWSNDWPGGRMLGSIIRDRAWLTGRIEGARILGHAVVVTTTDDGKLSFRALPLPKGSR